MIKQGTSGAEAELPFSIWDHDGAPVDGHSFSAGQVKIRLPGTTSFVNATTGNIVGIGNGQYVLQLTSVETSAEGTIFIKYSDGGTNRDYIGTEQVVSSGDELLELPFAIYDGEGDGQAGVSLSPGDLTIRLPGETSYSNATLANVVDLGEGQYVLTLTEDERSSIGTLFIHFDDGIHQTYDGYETNLVAGDDDDDTPTPVPVPEDGLQIAEYAHATAMLNRLPEYARQEVL